MRPGHRIRLAGKKWGTTTMHCNIRALQVFECIYRHSSIAKAAEELAITRSAISHQLRYLRM